VGMSDIFRVDWFAKDWLLKTQKLTLEERGVYIQIVSAIYYQGGAVDHDERYLANLCNCSVRKVKAIIVGLESYGFIQITNGKITQKRAEKELKNARKRRENNPKTSRKPSENEPVSNKNNDLSSTSQQTTVKEVKRITKVIPKNKKRGCRIDAEIKDGKIPDEFLIWAAHEFLDLTQDEIIYQWKKFFDYWIGISGEKGVKLNWLATWRNGLKNQLEWRNGNGKSTGNNRKPTVAEVAAKVNRELGVPDDNENDHGHGKPML